MRSVLRQVRIFSTQDAKLSLQTFSAQKIAKSLEEAFFCLYISMGESWLPMVSGFEGYYPCSIISNAPLSLVKRRASRTEFSAKCKDTRRQGIREGDSGGTSYPGLGGPEGVLVSALSFCSSPFFGQKIGLNLSEDLFFALHLILGKNSD